MQCFCCDHGCFTIYFLLFSGVGVDFCKVKICEVVIGVSPFHPVKDVRSFIDVF